MHSKSDAGCARTVGSAFSESAVAFVSFRFPVGARTDVRMSQCRMHHLTSSFDCPVFAISSPCLGACSLFWLLSLPYPSAPVLNTTIAVATLAAGDLRVISAGVLAIGLIRARPRGNLCLRGSAVVFRLFSLLRGAHLSGVVVVPDASPVEQFCRTLPFICAA